VKKVFLCVLMVVVLLSSIGCAQPVASEMIQSDKQRVTPPDANEADRRTLADGNSTFAFDLYQALREEDGNLFYSPYSISLALVMTYAGARGETAQQMVDTLYFALDQDSLHPAFNSLDIELASRGKGAKGKDEEGFRLNIVNAIWGQKGYKFLSNFLDILAENYGAGLGSLDFASSPEESRVTINNWVSEQTEGRIQDLIPQGLIDITTTLVLTNAIYFNAAWQYPFSEDMTDDGLFYLLNGDEVTVPMMKQTETFGYGEGEAYQVVEMPYDGRELSMLILLPRSGEFEAFESSLDYRLIEVIVRGLENRRVSLTMPKFEFDSEFSLKETLSAMGMPIAFSGDADFSGITGNRELWIADVIHKAFISLDEEGTEAAAATAVVIPRLSIPEEPVEFNVDRPFIFLIRDIETGTILFIGRVLKPNA